MLYLYNFRFLRFEIQSYGSPLKLISNSTSETNIGFFNKELRQISDDALIMDSFSRETLYGMPRIIVSTFIPEIAMRQTTIHLFQPHL